MYTKPTNFWLDHYTKKMIKAWIEKHLINRDNPRSFDKALTVNRSGQWRYRIGDYRVICLLENEQLVSLALSAGHRRSVYKNN